MSEAVKLDVGGTIFKTSKSTLTKFDGFFRTMLGSGIGLNVDESGCIFIDRSPKHFDLILNFMRDGCLALPKNERDLTELMAEAQYYLLDGLIDRLASSNWSVESDEKTINVAKRLPILENNSQFLQVLCNQEKPILLIVVMASRDHFFPNMSIPDGFNAYKFVEKYSHQFHIYFKGCICLEWSARIIPKVKPRCNTKAPTFEGQMKRLNYSDRLEKYIEAYSTYLEMHKHD
ncbi:BTB domain-containing protein [Caenorhabditis elegans]|uniref:BTB domain-containing protein n=1 Tax=Caenorhabditis elegans TaxID=6239 RepID=P91558_CAEEL|nr:BTB domain-containing protein [Caenorhabditis elegans]CCD64930.1 BTB domain-containing protein [Caenorhabditis elegans]|eukprot:NP_494476.2 Uncharacterized protein CELE_ZC239.4 [Caenorhabditis elegans]